MIHIKMSGLLQQIMAYGEMMMIHQEVRACFESCFKAPIDQTGKIEELYSALTQCHAETGPQFYGLSEEITYAPLTESALAESYPEGSVGAAWGTSPSAVSAFYHRLSKREPDEALARFLLHIGHISEPVRSVLSYPKTPSGDLSLHAFIARQLPNKASYLALTAWFGRTAFTDPQGTKPVYDALACGWRDGFSLPNLMTLDWNDFLGKTVADIRECLQLDPVEARPLACAPMPTKTLSEADLSGGIPSLLWDLISTPGKALDPYQITTAVAGLGAGFDTRLVEAIESTLLSFEGMAEITSTPIPRTVELERLKDTPEGSLGQAFYRLITDNNFDVEVLDPTSLFGPAEPGMSPGEWMNRRILQLHDVIHLIAGYEQTGEDEVAISGFQLAQIGQNYSACFIAVTSLISILYFPAGFASLIQLSLDGWFHGRTTKPLILMDWESLWGEQISTIRQMHKIVPFAGNQTKFPSLAAD